MKYVKEQTDEICLFAVRQDVYSLEYVDDQTPEICLAAVQQNPRAIRYVKIVFKAVSYEPKETNEKCSICLGENLNFKFLK